MEAVASSVSEVVGFVTPTRNDGRGTIGSFATLTSQKNNTPIMPIPPKRQPKTGPDTHGNEVPPQLKYHVSVVKTVEFVSGGDALDWQND